MKKVITYHRAPKISKECHFSLRLKVKFSNSSQKLSLEKSRPVSTENKRLNRSIKISKDEESEISVLEENAVLNKYLIEFNENVDNLIKTKRKDENIRDFDKIKSLKVNIIENEIKRNEKKLQDLKFEYEDILRRSDIIKDKTYVSSLSEEMGKIKEWINDTKRTNSLLTNDQKRNFKELNSLQSNDINALQAVRKLNLKMREAEKNRNVLIQKIETIKNEIYEITEKYAKLQSEYSKNKKVAVKEGVYLFDSEHKYYLLNLKVVKLEKSFPLLKRKQENQIITSYNEINSLKLK